jgi:hypothetical protein
MKIIELNIGLSTPQGGQLNFIEVLNALNARGFDLITYRLHDSICKDGVEKCLAVKLTPPADWQSQLASLSNKFGQDCIAVVGFIGHAPYDTFCADLWKSPENPKLGKWGDNPHAKDTITFPKETKDTIKIDVQTEEIDDSEFKAKAWKQELESYRSKLRELLTVNRWKVGSKQAIAAEYAFTLGIEAVKGPLAYLSICRLSGRSILD